MTSRHRLSTDAKLAGMLPITHPSVRLRFLARELKRLRRAAGMTQREVCAATGLSEPIFSRIENAGAAIPSTRVEILLELYGASPRDHAELMQAAKEKSKHGLWQPYAAVWKSGYADLEAEADEIFVWELAFVPGLLQTVGYYREVMEAFAAEPRSQEETELRVAGRMARQALLTRADPPAPRLHAVISEAVIRQMVGDPEVMRKQISSLWASAQEDNVTLQIVPFSAGAHPGMDGAFTLLDFEQYKMRISYVETPGGHIYLEDAAGLKGVNVRREGVLKAALDPSQSAALLREVADTV